MHSKLGVATRHVTPQTVRGHKPRLSSVTRCEMEREQNAFESLGVILDPMSESWGHRTMT